MPSALLHFSWVTKMKDSCGNCSLNEVGVTLALERPLTLAEIRNSAGSGRRHNNSRYSLWL